MATLGRLHVDLIANTQAFQKGLAGAQKSFTSVGRSMANVGKSLSAGVTLPIVAAGAAAFKFSNDFNAEMANVASLMPGNTARVQELGASVKQLSIDTGQSTGTMTEGLYNVVSAFGDTADTVGVLETNARAAVAGVSTVTDAIKLTSAVTKSYGDTTAQAVQHAADLGIMAVRLGQTTFPELAASIGSVTPQARELNVSQEELFATFATLTGVTGGAAEVSTQLRGALQALLTPTAATTGLFTKLGVESGAALIEQRGLQGAIDALTTAANATGEPLQKYIGSIEGQTFALSVAGAQSDTFKAKLSEMRGAAGATDAAFKEQTEGVNAAGFAWNQFKTIASVAMIELGAAVAPIFTQVIEHARKLVEWFTNLSPETQRVIAVVGALAAAIGPLIVVAGTLITAVGTVAGALAVLNPVTLAIVAAIGVLTAAFVLLDSEGRAKVLGVLKKMADKFKTFTKPIANMVKAVGRMTLKFIGLWLEVQATVLAIVAAMARGIWDWFVEWLAPLGQWLWDKVLEPFIGVLAMAANKISEWTGKVTGFFRMLRSKVTGEEVEPMAEQVQNLFSGMKDTVTNTVTGMARAVVGAVKGMGTDVVPPVQQMRLAVVGEVIQMGVAVQPLMEKMKANVTVPLIDAGTQAQMSMTAMKDAIAGPGGILSEFGGDTGKRVQAIVSNVTGKWGALRGVLERGDFDVSGFTALKESGLKILGGLLSKAGGIAKKLFGLFKGGGGLFGKIGGLFKGKGGGGLFGKIGGLFKGGLGKIGGAVLSGLGSVGSAAAGVLSAVAPVLSAAAPVLAIAGAGFLAFKGIKALTGGGASQRFTEEEKRQLGESNAAIAGRRGEAEGLGLIRPLWTAADAKDLGGVGGEVGRLGLGLTPAFEATNQAVSRIIDGQARTESRLDDMGAHSADAVSVLERIAGHTERFGSIEELLREVAAASAAAARAAAAAAEGRGGARLGPMSIHAVNQGLGQVQRHELRVADGVI